MARQWDSIEGIKLSPFTVLSVLVIVVAHAAAHVAARDDIEAIRAKDLNEMFPVTNAEAAPTANPRGFANLLWKQLNHLRNAGFDLALFRVDAYGNVLYLHVDSASPLAWDIDHWFPCARKKHRN
uniref:rRNA N-glycosidase n=1 Tax=Oryza meridionalis TaxID=40149 RepID=A0A0E0CPW8_9ORYZ